MQNVASAVVFHFAFFILGFPFLIVLVLVATQACSYADFRNGWLWPSDRSSVLTSSALCRWPLQ